MVARDDLAHFKAPHRVTFVKELPTIAAFGILTDQNFLIETRAPPGLLAPTLVTLPSMSRVPLRSILTSHFLLLLKTGKIQKYILRAQWPAIAPQ
jgi:hypothetical protein